MRSTTSGLRLVVASIAFLISVQVAVAQRLTQKQEILTSALNAFSQVPDAQKRILSSGGRNFFALAGRLNTPTTQLAEGGPLGDTARIAQAKAASFSPIELALGPGGVSRVSDPALDFQAAVFTGFSQNETSTAWCGDHVVVAYNDSGAFVRTFEVNPQAAASFDGISVSANGGRTFRDLGFLNPGANPSNFLNGDPVVFCTSANQFYYSSLLETAVADPQGNLQPITAVSLSSSANGGVTWANPVMAIGKNASGHFLDKPWAANDPGNPQQIYVTYTDIDISRTSAVCPGEPRIAIEIVASADAGNTWSAPSVVEQACGAAGNIVTGSNVVVARDGSVFVAYEFMPPAGNNEIHISRSVNHGSTFGAIVRAVTGIVPNGAQHLLQGLIRNTENPLLAVDRSSGSSAGTLYIVWSDGRDNIVPDVFTGTYAYPDVMIAKSTDDGMTFGTPQAVSPTPSTFSGTGRDQFFPSVAVDRNGHVGVCYYDRRGSVNNTVVDRFCSLSLDQGRSWSEQRVSFSNWLPMHDNDITNGASYIGDYDALTSDALGVNDGFIGAFEIETQGNPDVYARRF